MTGSLLAPLSFSSPSPVAPNYSVDSFSEFSTRIVHRASFSPTSAVSTSRSRAQEEDEELFRDLFAGENDVEVGEEAPGSYKLAVPTFIPQKPATQRVGSLTGNPNPRQHLAPMKSAPSPLVLSTPFIPRLRLEELVNARPDDDDEDDKKIDSQRASRRLSELEQVEEEDESCFDDGLNEYNDGNTAPKKAQFLTRERRFSSSLSFAVNNQNSNNDDKLKQETMQFLENLNLKTVLHTPRPELLSFYPGMAITPTSRSMACPDPARDRIKGTQQKNDAVFNESFTVPRVDTVASRLAYMTSTYGTAPVVRKTRRETIDRLANPISGHSSTLQALSPRQREKREAANTNRAPLSPLSAAIAVSCRRVTTTKKTKTPATFRGGQSKRVVNSALPVPTLATSKRNVAKWQDPLVHKRRSNSSTNPHSYGQAPTISGLTKRQTKTTTGSRSLVARKESLKKKLQSRPGPIKRCGDRQIGGSTFLTQCDDEDDIDRIEAFIAQSRGATQASLTFRSGTKTPLRPALPTRNPTTGRSRPRPPSMRVGVPLSRVSDTSKNTYRGRGARTSRGLESLSIATDERPKTSLNSTRGGRYDHEPVQLFQQPRRPQAWQTTSRIGHSRARILTERPTNQCHVANPLRRLKVQRPRAPESPPSAATTLLIGSAPFFSLSGATTDVVKSAYRGTKKVSARKSTTGNGASSSFNTSTKLSEQCKRIPSARVIGGPRQIFTVARSTSGV